MRICNARVVVVTPRESGARIASATAGKERNKMKLDRTASLSPSLAAACCALIGLSAFGGCMIDDRCDRHPEDPNCSYVTDTYRDHGTGAGSYSGGGSSSGKGGCAGTSATGSAGRPGTGGSGRAGTGGAIGAGTGGSAAGSTGQTGGGGTPMAGAAGSSA